MEIPLDSHKPTRYYWFINRATRPTGESAMEKTFSLDTIRQYQAWRAEAKQWVLECGTQFVTALHRGAHINPGVTVGQIVSHLDSLKPVPGYALLRHEPSLRYQLVRSVVETAAKTGTFAVGTTVNTKGRDSNCFSPPDWKPTPRRRRPSLDGAFIEVEVAEGVDREAVEAKVRERLSAIGNITGLHAVFVDVNNRDS